MTDLLKTAIDRVRSLPDEAQDEFARILLRLAGEEEAVYVLTEEEDADLTAAENEVLRGELASDSDIEAVFGKYRT